MQLEKIARRYARAIMLMTNNDDTLKKIEIDLSNLALLFKRSNSDFLELILNPVFFNDERKKVMSVLADQFDFQRETRQFVDLLIDKNRLCCLPFIDVVFSSELDMKLFRARTTLVSASQLAEQEIKNIVQALQNRLGKNVEAKTQVDKKVLGGVRAKIGGFVFDGTLETQLNMLKQSLISSSSI